MEDAIKRGQVFFAMLEPVVGSEQGGRRPVAVVSNDLGNRHGPTVVVVPVTTGAKASLPTHVNLEGEAGLSGRSVALCEQVRAIDKCRLLRLLGSLSPRALALVGASLEIELGMARDAQLMVLCPACADSFANAGPFSLRRIDPNAPRREFCTVCSAGRGHEYVLTRRTGERP